MRLFFTVKIEKKDAIVSGGFCPEAENPDCVTLKDGTPAYRGSLGIPEKIDGGYCVLYADADPGSILICEGALEESEGGFYGSVTAGTDYRLGMYLNPVCLLTAAVSPENVGVAEEENGLARFAGDSEKMYVECLCEKLREKFGEFDLFAARSCLEALTAAGKMTRSENGNYVIYTDREGNRIPICRHYSSR